MRLDGGARRKDGVNGAKRRVEFIDDRAAETLRLQVVDRSHMQSGGEEFLVGGTIFGNQATPQILLVIGQEFGEADAEPRTDCVFERWQIELDNAGTEPFERCGG